MVDWWSCLGMKLIMDHWIALFLGLLVGLYGSLILRVEIKLETNQSQCSLNVF